MGYNPESQDRDLEFTAKDEAATLPRVTELVIITKHSPWSTVVKNPAGVSQGNICASIWKECVPIPTLIMTLSSSTFLIAYFICASYADHPITEDEFASLAPAMQDRVRRTAANRMHMGAGSRYMGWAAASDPTMSNRCLRIGTQPLPLQLSPQTVDIRVALDLLREKVFFDGLEIDDSFARDRLGFAAPNIAVMHLTS